MNVERVFVLFSCMMFKYINHTFYSVCSKMRARVKVAQGQNLRHNGRSIIYKTKVSGSIPTSADNLRKSSPLHSQYISEAGQRGFYKQSSLQSLVLVSVSVIVDNIWIAKRAGDSQRKE